LCFIDDLLFFLNDLGWDFDPLPDEVDAIRTPALHLASLLPDDVDGDWPDGETLIAASRRVLAIAGWSRRRPARDFKTTSSTVRQSPARALSSLSQVSNWICVEVLGLIKVETGKSSRDEFHMSTLVSALTT